MKQKFKFGTIVKVLSIINGVLMVLAAIVFLFLQEIIFDIIAAETNADLSQFAVVFYVAAIILVLFAILTFAASAQVPTSKGWNIYIIVFAGLSVLGGLADFEIFSILFYGTMVIFAILNVVEANKRQNFVPTTSGSIDLETKLKTLNDLYDKGLISSEEYQKSRQEAIEKTE